MFHRPAPAELIHALEAKREELPPELRAHFGEAKAFGFSPLGWIRSRAKVNRMRGLTVRRRCWAAFKVMPARSWPEKKLLSSDGAMMAIEAAGNEFYVAGRGLYVFFLRDPDVDDKVGGIASMANG